ncbi:MAG: hypothetical protein WBE76_25430 [Terracidiphilus sp.]
MSARAKARSTGSPAGRNSRSRILLTVLVALAMLLILLRLAEFASHRIRHATPHVAPAAMTAAAPGLNVLNWIRTEP